MRRHDARSLEDRHVAGEAGRVVMASATLSCSALENRELWNRRPGGVTFSSDDGVLSIGEILGY